MSMEHWPASLRYETPQRDGRVVRVSAALHLERPVDAMVLWLRLVAEEGDSSAVWSVDAPLATLIESNVTVVPVRWTLLRDPALSASNRSVTMALPRIVGHLLGSPTGSPLRTLRSQSDAAYVVVDLEVGPSPMLRYLASALGVVAAPLLLYLYVFRHLDAVAVQLQNRRDSAVQAAANPAAAAAAALDGVQIFSAAARSNAVKRFVGGPGATRAKPAKAKN